MEIVMRPKQSSRPVVSALTAACLCAAGLSVLAAQAPEDRATVQMRDGTKVEGRIEALGKGTLFLRVSLADQRRIPVDRIALIDRKGGAMGLPETEIRVARDAAHLLLLTAGTSVTGQLTQIRGGEGSGDPGPRTYIFTTVDGRELTYPPEQVSRIYLGRYPFDAAVTKTVVVDTVDPPLAAGAVRVPAKADWVATGVAVRKGEMVSFRATGDVQLSDNAADRAQAAGTTRMAPLAPLPAVSAGALIGRIGLRGVPFGIGNQLVVPMPSAGMLYLAVNDGERSDNAGEFIIVVNGKPQ